MEPLHHMVVATRDFRRHPSVKCMDYQDNPPNDVGFPPENNDIREIEWYAIFYLCVAIMREEDSTSPMEF